MPVLHRSNRFAFASGRSAAVMLSPQDVGIDSSAVGVEESNRGFGSSSTLLVSTDESLQGCHLRQQLLLVYVEFCNPCQGRGRPRFKAVELCARRQEIGISLGNSCIDRS